MIDNADWITTNQASELSGYHPDYIRKLLQSNKIIGRKWGFAWMVDRDSLLTYLEQATIQARADFVYDELADDIEKIDLNTGDGFIDLRELNILFTPIDIMDVKAGRQILTWGTGDLLFINDLFPKDWNSFLLGRDEEYLKAPSDAVFASFFPALGNLIPVSGDLFG